MRIKFIKNKSINIKLHFILHITFAGHITDTTRVWPLHPRRPAPVNLPTITIKNLNTVHPSNRMLCRIFTIKTQIKSTMHWANKIAICHDKCFWNRTVMVHGKCYWNKRASVAFPVKTAMHRVNYCWNKIVVDRVACYQNRTQPYRTSTPDAASYCVRIRMHRDGSYFRNRTAAYRSLSRERECCANRKPKYLILKVRRIRCAARTVLCRSSNRSVINWLSRIRWYHLLNHQHDPQVTIHSHSNIIRVGFVRPMVLALNQQTNH